MKISCTLVGVCLFVFSVSGGLSQILSQDKQLPIKQRAMATNPIKNVFVAVCFPQTELEADRCQSFSVTLLDPALPPPTTSTGQQSSSLSLWPFLTSLLLRKVIAFPFSDAFQVKIVDITQFIESKQNTSFPLITKHQMCYPALVAGLLHQVFFVVLKLQANRLTDCTSKLQKRQKKKKKITGASDKTSVAANCTDLLEDSERKGNMTRKDERWRGGKMGKMFFEVFC